MKSLPYFVVGSIFFLSGCLEVDDNSNETVANALNEQNALLKQELENQQSTFYGRLVKSLDSQPISAATVTVLAGSDFSKSVTPNADGTFTIDDIPYRQEAYVLVSSTDSSFAPLLLATERYRGQDLGTIELSESHQVQFNAINQQGDAIKGLEFYAYNHELQNRLSKSNNLPSAIDQVRLTSTFDEDSGQYLIDLPKYQTIDVLVKLDTDNDKIADFSIDTSSHDFLAWENSNDSIPVNTAQFTLRNSNQIELSLIESGEIELRFSIQYNTSDTIQSLTNAKIFGPSSNNDRPVSQFNEELQQHVIKVPKKSITRLSLPAFSQGDLSFSSKIYSVKIDQDIVSFYEDSSGFTLFSRPITEVLDAVITLEPSTSTAPQVDVLNAGLANNESVDIYYSQPISVFDDQVITFNKLQPQITREDVGGQVRVNVNVTEQPIAQTHETTLNDTKLSIVPTSDLTEGFYRFNVAEVEIQQQGKFDATITDVADDSGEFYLSGSETFNVEDIIADNLTNRSNETSLVRFLLPMTIRTLEKLTLEVIESTEDGTQQTHSFNPRSIVNDGSMDHYDTQLKYTLTLAESEYLQNDFFNSPLRFDILRNSSLSEGQFFYSTQQYDLYLADNTNASINNVTLLYSYTTKSGTSKSGKITLPIK